MLKKEATSIPTLGKKEATLLKTPQFYQKKNN